MDDDRILRSTIEALAVELTAPAWLTTFAETTLSSEERKRACRFRFAENRQQYVLSHACLRVLIARYVCSQPNLIRFSLNEWGKPLTCGASLEFNLSHSGNIAVYAFTVGCAVGIDVEQCRAMPDLLSIAQRFFAREECADLIATAHDDRQEAFFRCWTRKESFIKALGQGLSYPLNGFQVSLKLGQPALLSINAGAEAARNWAFFDIHPAPGYIGSIAARDPLRELRILPGLCAYELLEPLARLG